MRGLTLLAVACGIWVWQADGFVFFDDSYCPLESVEYYPYGKDPYRWWEVEKEEPGSRICPAPEPTEETLPE